jgi:hypothetical protein
VFIEAEVLAPFDQRDFERRLARIPGARGVSLKFAEFAVRPRLLQNVDQPLVAPQMLTLSEQNFGEPV